MNEKKYKKDTAKVLSDFGLSFDDAKKTAYQLRILARDLATFQASASKEDFQAFKDSLQSDK